MFGNERFGLPNEIVERCNVLINIPANPAYSSLNLAQAVQVLAYECRLAATGDMPPDAGIGFRGEPPSRRRSTACMRTWSRRWWRSDFLDPANPKKLMPRMKRLFARSGLETEEVNILRGIARQILEKVPATAGAAVEAAGAEEVDEVAGTADADGKTPRGERGA